MELVESKTYEIEELEKVEYEVHLDDYNGIEETAITIYLSDGSFRVHSFRREI